MRVTQSTMLTVVLFAGISAEALAQKKSPAVTRDADRDGVPDMRDRCAATAPRVPVDSFGCPAGEARPAAAAVVDSAPAVVTVRTRVGIGVGVGSGSGAILVPILLASGISVEPEFGAGHQSAHFSGFASGDYSLTYLRIGVTLHVPLSRSATLNTWAGPRLGVMKTWTSDNSGGGGTVSVAAGDWFGGFGAGGEFFLSDQASIGAEIMGEYQHSHDAGSAVTTTGSDVRTTGRVSGRLYFGR